MNQNQTKTELGKIDCKCWICGVMVAPTVVSYNPLICKECLPAYSERKFVFVRASQEEMDELFLLDTKRREKCIEEKQEPKKL